MSSETVLNNYIFSNKRIGCGSFSEVYQGYNRKDPNHKVAIKKIRISDNYDLNYRIETEINVMKNLSHPNVIELYDVIGDSEGDHLYLVLEYCAKGDLSKYLNKRPVTEKYAKKYLKQIASGLQYLLSKNIIHRDLKPQNILISSNNALKIADFGFAKFFRGDEIENTVCGSPLYMAPEIMKDHEYTIKADLWSLGVILYQLLFGKAPFKSKSPARLMREIETFKFEVPTDLKIDITMECYELLNSLLQVEPEKRIEWKDFFENSWLLGTEDAIRQTKISDTMTISQMGKMIDQSYCNKVGKPLYSYREESVFVGNPSSKSKESYLDRIMNNKNGNKDENESKNSDESDRKNNFDKSDMDLFDNFNIYSVRKPKGSIEELRMEDILRKNHQNRIMSQGSKSNDGSENGKGWKKVEHQEIPNGFEDLYINEHSDGNRNDSDNKQNSESDIGMSTVFQSNIPNIIPSKPIDIPKDQPFQLKNYIGNKVRERTYDMTESINPGMPLDEYIVVSRKNIGRLKSHKNGNESSRNGSGSYFPGVMGLWNSSVDMLKKSKWI